MITLYRGCKSFSREPHRLVTDYHSGHIPLHLSPSLSHTAATSLMDSENATFVLLASQYEENHPPPPSAALRLQRIPWQVCSFLHNGASVLDSGLSLTSGIPAQGMPDEIACILHSTGSTANPKPIPSLHRNLIATGMMFESSSRLCLSPISHAYAYYHSVICLTHGDQIFLPRTGVALGRDITSDFIIRAIQASRGKARLFTAVPRFLELLVDEPRGLVNLAQFAGVTVCGGMLSTNVAQQLLDFGIPLQNLVAATECAPMMSSGPPRTSTNWNHLMVDERLASFVEFRMFDSTEQSYELLVQPRHPCLRLVIHDHGVWRSGDLYKCIIKDQGSANGTWTYYRRANEVICHSTGMKSDTTYGE